MTLLAHNPASLQAETFDPHGVRADFPILSTAANGKPLVYLDNGATTQKPRQVIDAITHYYESQNANIHRGVYQLSQVATEAYEAARRKVAAFLNAGDEKQILFTRGTTEGINLVAGCWGRTFLKPGDEVIVSAMEHHSNIVPWQIACEMTGAKLRVIPINEAGELLMDEYAKLLGPRTKIVSVTHLSNALGTINDVKKIAEMAHEVGALMMADGAQWVAHYPTDLRELGVDFYAFSGHKLFGPTGIGVLFGRRELLEKMPPYQGGGDMIESVTFEKTTYAQIPNKFEAGTPDIAGAVGLGAAVDYLRAVGFDAFAAYEEELLAYATKELRKVPGLRLVGTAARKGTVLSFVLEDPPVASLDIGMKLDALGIAVRTGHHCCQPVMAHFCIPATTRASLALYNTREEIDALAAGLQEIVAEAKQSARRRETAPPPAKGGIVYPEPFAASPQEAADRLAEVFEMLGEREEKTRYIENDLGEKLPDTFDLLKKVAPRVPGCMSEVYVVGRRSPESPEVLEFIADANSPLVRGLIALLQRLYSGHRAADVLSFDVENFFHRIGLDQFISTQRRNGLAGMTQRIREMAAKLATAPAPAAEVTPMTEDPDALYREVILDHSKRPRNFRAMPDATGRAEGHNRDCGDWLALYVKLDAGVLADVSFEGRGCAIHTAAASLMTQAVRGKSPDEARELFDRFHETLTAGDGAPAPELGKLVVFQNVRRYPARVKCATLSWHALRAALGGDAAGPVSTG